MPSLWGSGSGAASRSTQGRQSIRGRISGPIPIPSPADDEFPIRSPGSSVANAAVEEEFPIRNPGSGIASMTPLPEETDSESPHQQQEQQREQNLPPPDASADSDSVSVSPADVTQSGSNPDAPSHHPPAPPSANSSGRAKTPPQRISPQRISPQKSSPPRSSPPRRRTNPASMLRYSSVSEAPSGNTGRSRDEAPQRKKSTLRTALGRLFGRKKKPGGSQTSSTPSGRMSGMLTSSQHRSDPSALNRCKDDEPKRSASLPITEYDRALRSHSIGPQDMTAIETVRSSLQTERGPTHRRAATMSSRLFSQPRRNPGWVGLSPRPASTHGRDSRLIAGGEDPSEIGRAITSDSGGGTRRRSRSLSGLYDIAGARPGQRRRSDEIRYWRESYDPGFLSPLSSTGPDETEADNDNAGVAGAPESPADRPPKTPPQPFNFGSISNEMAGMKITQAASMDSRIGGLEARMFKLERVVNQLCHSVPGFKTPLVETPRRGEPSSMGVTSDPSSFFYTTAAPPMIPAIYQAISGETRGSSRHGSSRQSLESDWQSHLSFGEAQTFIGSLHPPSSSATQAQSLTATAPPAISPANRPTSNSTIRGAASLPTMGRDAGDESGDAAGLLNQLEAERVARQALEAQVKKLSERLNTLSTTMYAMVRDPARSRSQEHLRPPAPALQQSRSASGPLVSPMHTPLKARSAFEGDDDSETDKGPVQRGAGEDEQEEDFQTPRPHYGAFGEELREDDGDEDDPKRKKAARTLSLSQLTLGRGAQLQI